MQGSSLRKANLIRPSQVGEPVSTVYMALEGSGSGCQEHMQVGSKAVAEFGSYGCGKRANVIIHAVFLLDPFGIDPLLATGGLTRTISGSENR